MSTDKASALDPDVDVEATSGFTGACFTHRGSFSTSGGGDTMPLKRYGVLVGQVVDRRAEGGTDSPHFQIQVRGGDVDFRTANCWCPG